MVGQFSPWRSHYVKRALGSQLRNAGPLPTLIPGMGRRLAGLTVAIAFMVVVTGSQDAWAASEGGPLTQRCRGIDEELRGPCRGVEQLVTAASANCRYLGVASEEDCTLPFAPRVMRSAVEAYRGSWVHRALGLQYALGSDVGLRNAPWVGTHNTFNSVAEMGPTLSDTDANQQLSIADQLRLDVRSIELDVHWFPGLRSASLARRPVVCHAFGNHGGCTIEKPLGSVLSQIASWLRRPHHRDQVLLLYVQDQLDNATGYNKAVAVVKARLGNLVYRPSGPGCTPLPLGLTRDQVLEAGGQVVIVSGCGEGSAWPGVVFDWSARKETRPHNFTDFPVCGTDWDRATFDSTLIRYFEDSTALTANAATLGADENDDGITPMTAAQMARCGVDLTGMDQLLPDDGRLEALVWSWAPRQPRRGACAVQRVNERWPFGRWFSRPCAERHRPACRAAADQWLVAAGAVPERAADPRCRAEDARHAVPRTGYEAQQLRLAMARAGVHRVWLGYRREGGTWEPQDPRG